MEIYEEDITTIGVGELVCDIGVEAKVLNGNTECIDTVVDYFDSTSLEEFYCGSKDTQTFDKGLKEYNVPSSLSAASSQTNAKYGFEDSPSEVNANQGYSVGFHHSNLIPGQGYGHQRQDNDTIPIGQIGVDLKLDVDKLIRKNKK